MRPRQLPLPTRAIDGLRLGLLLVFVLASVVAMLPVLLFTSNEAAPLRLGGAIGLLGLAAWFVWGYRGERLPTLGVLLEAVVLTTVAIAIGGPGAPPGLLFPSLMFRVFHSSLVGCVGAVVAATAAYLLSGIAWPALHGLPPTLAPGQSASDLIGLPVVGLVLFCFRLSLLRAERAAQRERSLAQAGARLVAGTDSQQLQAVALDAVRGVLAQARVLRTALALRRDDGTLAVRAEGLDAERATGTTIDVRRLPRASRPDVSQQQFVVDRATTADLAGALGFPLHPGVVTLTPLTARDRPLGVLIVESAERLPDETADALATLANEVALALDGLRLTEDLRMLAYHDPLTGLANRARFTDCLQQALARAHADDSALAVLFLDLDNFKLVNDSLGHAAGDRLLGAVAERVRACVRPGDLVARLGGDEFTVLLEDVADASAAIAVAERIAAELTQVVELEGRCVTVSSSVGIALSQQVAADRTPVDAGELLRAADLAVYAAKARGKAQAALFQPAMAADAEWRLGLEAELRLALEQDAFQVHYQPLVQLDDGRIGEVEALVRWQHPQRGLVGPAEFIGIAEETGLIVPLGRWVLQTACRQARAWQTAFPVQPPLRLSVNLSARQLRDAHLVDDVRRILAETGLDPRTLRLEITESVAVADTPHNRATLSQLRQLGVRLAVDDFGTGNAAIDYLRRLPVDTLKIDRSFIDQVGQDERSTALVHGIIAFAKSLGLHVTGEGIETPEQSAHLRAMGCDWGQGYLFARPVAADALAALLAAETDTDHQAAVEPRAA